MVIVSCSSSKYLDDDEYLLESVEVRTDDKNFDAVTFEPYIRQKANSKWFSMFKIPLGTYNLSGTDTTKWINRTLRSIGEKPVVYDTLQARLTCDDLERAMKNLGYMHSSVSLNTHVRGKKLKAIYTLYPGEPYYIDNVSYDIQDSRIAKILQTDIEKNRGIHEGDQFTVGTLDEERKRITQILLDSGFYKFNKDYIQYSADSISGQKSVGVTLHLLPFNSKSDAELSLHPRYYINNVSIENPDTSVLTIRKKVLKNNVLIEAGKYYSSKDVQGTYKNFARLQAIRSTNIRFQELPDSTSLDCKVLYSTNSLNSVSFQPEGTNTAGNLGAAATVTYQNRNLFRGSELFSVSMRAAFEAITGLEGYNDADYEEYNIESKITFPRLVAPFLSRSFIRSAKATTDLSVSYNLQNRPEFHRRVFSAAVKYKWADPKKNINYNFDVLDLNYIHMPWISAKFKHDYIDSTTNRNAILRYNYEDLFIMKAGFGISYANNVHAIRANIETAGNLLNATSGLFGMKKNSEGQKEFFNIAFAQYVKGDFDYTRALRLSMKSSLVFHAALGIAYPYGNSKVLPFEKRYFSGGANSVRGWSVRGIGPGKFKGTDGAIDFINQTGDMKIDLNMEYRIPLFWKFNGALFVDAGNIWTLREYDDQPGGMFKFDTFLEQIAVAYGIGIRLNFSYFVLRFDGGMKAINPAYGSKEEHYTIVHPNLKRDFAFHFAVGLPF